MFEDVDPADLPSDRAWRVLEAKLRPFVAKRVRDVECEVGFGTGSAVGAAAEYSSFSECVGGGAANEIVANGSTALFDSGEQAARCCCVAP